MATIYHNLSEYDFDTVPNAADMRFGIVASEWNQNITEKLLEGACNTLERHGAKQENIRIERVPGSFELPLGAQRAAADHDAVVALVRAAGAAGSGQPDRVAGALASLSLASGDGIAGAGLTFSGQTALDPSSVVALTATSQDPGLRTLPGGGIQPGETDRQAAARELAEESGIVVDPADLEGPVARRDAVFRFATVTCRQDEVFFLLRLRGPLALERAGWTQLERDAVDSISWWTPAELDAARRTGWEISPSAVPGLVGSLRAGWDGRPLDLTEPPDAELLAQVAAGGTRSGGGRATS